MTTKYPNADTSPERFQKIQLDFTTGMLLRFSPNHVDEIVRDLLAMLQVRDSTIAYDRQILHATEDRLRDERAVLDELQRDIKGVSQQLHDQRWRRFPDEKPELEQPIQIRLRGILDHVRMVNRYSQQAGTPQKTLVQAFQAQRGDMYYPADEDGIWWRPIPPLPKE